MFWLLNLARKGFINNSHVYCLLLVLYELSVYVHYSSLISLLVQIILVTVKRKHHSMFVLYGMFMWF